MKSYEPSWRVTYWIGACLGLATGFYLGVIFAPFLAVAQ